MLLLMPASLAVALDQASSAVHITPEILLEVIKALWGLSMAGFSIAGWMFWKLWKRVEDNLVDICAHHRACREELPLRYISRIEFDRRWAGWEPGRDDLWEAVNHHYHDDKGGVVRGKK